MQYSIITPKNFTTTKWSGGTSTELLIYPPDSDYKKGNFDFRLSTATVEVEKSDFTSLPGVSRKLMILDGEIAITHENHYNKKLRKFDIDSFEGDWKTTSIGKCVDFNLMTKGNGKGELSAISIEADQEVKYLIGDSVEHLILYALSEDILIKSKQKSHHLQKGNLLIIHQTHFFELRLTARKDCDVILSKIFK